MKLTDRQRIKLREGIESVLSEDKLKSILLEHENQFGRNFYNQIYGGDYRTRIINLLKELDNQRKLRDLIEIVNKEYPSIQERYLIYAQLSSLIFLLKKIFKGYQNFRDFFEDFEDIDELENHLLELTEDTQILSDIDTSRLDSYPSFIDFVEEYLDKILTAKDIKDNLKPKLRRWIEKNCPDAVITDEQQILSTLQSYLLITISPLGCKTKNNPKPLLNVRAELIENWGKTQNTKVELNKEDIKENGYSEQEIPNIIYKFIDRVQNEYLRPQVLKNQDYDLKVELFLTRKFFTKDFEFKIPDAFRQKQRAICEEKSVILRSLERLQPNNTSWLNSCIKKWQGIRKTAIIAENILAFEHENELNKLLSKPQQIKQLGIKLEKQIILKISCGLPKGKSKEHLFEIILEKGVPLCLWLKSKDKRDELNDSDYQSLINQLNNLIEVEDLQDVNRLYAKIFDIRKKHLADTCKKRCLGYHLRILCDYTERRPINMPTFNQLTTNY
ncbi:MAG: hypothetical protein SWX82_07620 [Cyanobacteriota bacterium]|nr:hypothetical protein [Cyanobacteriota bacterium]